MVAMTVKKAVKKTTRAERVRRQLEEDILTGYYQPGDRLDEVGLSVRLGCSRTPVREALNQLVALGLLNRRNHCGVHVAERHGDWLAEMAEAYGALEGVCIDLAMARMPLGVRKTILRNSRSAATLIASFRKHSGNAVLQELAEGQKSRIDPVVPVWGVKGDAIDSMLLKSLSDALGSGDGNRVASVLRARIDDIRSEAGGQIKA